MIANLISFSLRLFILLLITFGIHQLALYSLHVDWNLHLIIESYLTNFVLVLITYAIIHYYKDKKSQSLGFIFLGGFFLKLLFFMLFFKPVYKFDSEISTLEFAAFFVPYAVCLAFETIVLVRLLNRS